jgi:hypothetical protein
MSQFHNCLSDKLSDKVNKFIDSYLLTRNVTLSASMAGYKHSQSGRRIMSSALVSAAIKAKDLAIQSQSELTPEMIISELEKIAKADASDILSWSTDCDGNMSINVKDSLDVSDPGKYISSVTLEFGKGTKPLTKVKFIDKAIQIQALGVLAKIKGMITDKVDVSTDNQINVVIDSSLLAKPTIPYSVNESQIITMPNNEDTSSLPVPDLPE